MSLSLIQDRFTIRDRMTLYNAADDVESEILRRMCSYPYFQVFSLYSLDNLLTIFVEEISSFTSVVDVPYLFYKKAINIIDCIQYLGYIPSHSLETLLSSRLSSIDSLFHLLVCVIERDWDSLASNHPELSNIGPELRETSDYNDFLYAEFLLEFSEILIRLDHCPEVQTRFKLGKVRFLYLCRNFCNIDNMSDLLRQHCTRRF